MPEPTLSGDLDLESIYLKQLDEEDVTAYYVSWLNDPEITKYLEIRHAKQPITLQSVKDHVRQCNANRRHHWGVFIHGKHVGNVSCSMYSHVYNWVDVSILIGDRACWGKKLGWYVMAGAVEHLFSISGFNRIQSGAYSVHGASINLFLNLGFRKEAELKEAVIVDGRYADVVKFGLLKLEWLEKKMAVPRVLVYAPKWELEGAER
jgi:[ribosomal protein S5]-alanine N-acetyltransferase